MTWTSHNGETSLAIHQGDALTVLRTMPAESVHCCITSPPYWGLRDYGAEGQIGLEETPEAYVARLVEVFREVRRLLRPDGTLWLNLGDSYASDTKGDKRTDAQERRRDPNGFHSGSGARWNTGRTWKVDHGLKPKDLCGIPWRVAFALQADGWWLRSDIIWSKPNPMPESVTDRPTKAHEYLFLLAKAGRYYYDADAIREPQQTLGERHEGKSGYREGHPSKGGISHRELHPIGRNRRTVWTIATEAYPEAHFATFPTALVEPCILAGCPEGGTILDPFAGSGTTLLVAQRLGRNAIGIELSPDYCRLAEKRLDEHRQMRLPLGVTL